MVEVPGQLKREEMRAKGRRQTLPFLNDFIKNITPIFCKTPLSSCIIQIARLATLFAYFKEIKMPLVPMRQLLNEAAKGNYAVLKLRPGIIPARQSATVMRPDFEGGIITECAVRYDRR